MNKIIAIVGMCGSGKSVASEYLENNLQYKKVYFGGVTMKKLQEEGLEVNPENEKMMREKLRQDLGMGAYAKVLLSKIKELSIKISNILSINNLARIDFLYEEKTNNIYLIEINTLPGFTNISMYPKLLEYDKIKYKKIITLLIEDALTK